jgi:hypothetical protein
MIKDRAGHRTSSQQRHQETARITGEITRRLLPTVREVAAILAAAQAERDARLTGRLDTFLKAPEFLGGDLTWDEQGAPERPAESTMPPVLPGPSGAPHVAIVLRLQEQRSHRRGPRLTHDQVLIIVEAAARITASPPGMPTGR